MKSIRVEPNGRELWECPCGFVGYSFDCPACAEEPVRDDPARGRRRSARAPEPVVVEAHPPAPDDLSSKLAGLSMETIERAAIRGTLIMVRGNRRQAAEALKIGERTLYRKIDQYGLTESRIYELEEIHS